MLSENLAREIIGSVLILLLGAKTFEIIVSDTMSVFYNLPYVIIPQKKVLLWNWYSAKYGFVMSDKY